MSRYHVLPDTIAPPLLSSPIRMAGLRLALGLLQGMAFWGVLEYALVSNEPSAIIGIWRGLELICLFCPSLLILGLGHIPARRLGLWLVVVAILCAALGYYDYWRMAVPGLLITGLASPPLLLMASALFFLGHTFVHAGAGSRRWLPPYPLLFETASQLVAKLALVLGFTGVLLMLVSFGGALFALLKLDLLGDLLSTRGFYCLILPTAAACAVQICDAQPAMLRTIYPLLLKVAAWMLPVNALFATAFLLALPWTGLASLWATGHATAILLWLACTLMFQVNALVQDGRQPLSAGWRLGLRLGALLPLPLMTIAICALSLRVQQYGWSQLRIFSAVALSFAGYLALGYAYAACRRVPLAVLAKVNISAALVAMVTLLALFSPLADPLRLAVASQTACLLEGQHPERPFDYDYLRRYGGRYGDQALSQLSQTTIGPKAELIRRAAQAAMLRDGLNPSVQQPAPIPPSAQDLAKTLVVHGKQALPASFLAQNWLGTQNAWGMPKCLINKAASCDAYLLDLDGDGVDEVVLLTPGDGNWVYQLRGQVWFYIGDLRNPENSRPWQDALAANEHYSLVVPPLKDLQIGTARYRLEAR